MDTVDATTDAQKNRNRIGANASRPGESEKVTNCTIVETELGTYSCEKNIDDELSARMKVDDPVARKDKIKTRELEKVVLQTKFERVAPEAAARLALQQSKERLRKLERDSKFA